MCLCDHDTKRMCAFKSQVSWRYLCETGFPVSMLLSVTLSTHQTKFLSSMWLFDCTN